MTTQNLISIIEIAANHGRHRQTIHKIVKRLGIDTIKVKVSNEGARGQKLSHITIEDYTRLQQYLAPIKQNAADNNVSHGIFFLLLLEPNFDPGRFKVGFATDTNERVRSHKTVAPLSKIIKTWPCKILWEKTAIECVTSGCERLYTEVFRTDEIQKVVERSDRFFELMPRLDGKIL